MASVAVSLAIAGGGMALQYLLAPRQKQAPVDKGKFDDIRIQGVELGYFIPRGWGVFRLAGVIFFSNGVQHYILESPSSGGKGAPSAPSTRTHVYTTTLGIIACRGVADFRRVWADADLIANNGTVAAQDFFEAEDATLTGGASVAADATASGDFFVENLGAGGVASFDFTSGFADPDDPPGEPVYLPYTRISLYYKCTGDKTATLTPDVGAPVDILLTDSGDLWTVATHHFAGHVETLDYGGAAATADLDKIGLYYYYQREDLQVNNYQITGAPNPDIAYPTNLDDPSEYYNYIPTKDGATGETSFGSVVPGAQTRFYTGTESQTQDSAYIAYLDTRFGSGIDYASAMRALSYVVFQDTQLKQGRVQNYTFEMQRGAADVTDILTDLFADVGITDFDLATIAGKTQIGFLEFRQGSRRSLIEQLERYHHFRLAEIGGEVVAVDESDDSIATISEDDLKAHLDTEEMPNKSVEILIKEEQFLPFEVKYSAMIPEHEFHNESIPSEPMFDTNAAESKEYVFNIIDDADTVRERANIQLYKEHAESKAYEFFGMPALAKYSPGDVLELELNGVEHKFRIEKQHVGLPIGVNRFQAVSVEPEIFALTGAKNTSKALSEEQKANTSFPRNSVIFAVDSLPIREQEKGKLFRYLFVSGRGRGAWENCAVYRELSEGDYRLNQIVDSPSPLGIGQNDLDSWSDRNTKDTGSSFTVYFFDDVEFENVIQDDIDRYPNINLMRIGDEWLQFMTATPESLDINSLYKSAWTFENLWRGRYGTDMPTHGGAEYAGVVTPALRIIELDESDIGEEISLKAVTNGQALEVAPVTTFTFNTISEWTITNLTEDRTFDANATSTGELADALGTLIRDLRR